MDTPLVSESVMVITGFPLEKSRKSNVIFEAFNNPNMDNCSLFRTEFPITLLGASGHYLKG